MRRILGGAPDGAEISGLSRLTGGANMESWSFSFAGNPYVLRRAPSPEMMVGRPYGHDVEAALIRHARKGGVKAPEIVGELDAGDGLGTGFVMRFITGEVHPGRILAEPSPELVADIAAELAKIHTLPVDGLPPLPRAGSGQMLADLQTQFAEYGADRPVIALAIKWCSDNQPSPVPPQLVHGDFRMGNIMANEDCGNVAAILDWELAHLGDGHEDLAWGCVGAWRFGHYDRPALGLSGLVDYFAAYEAAGGGPVDRARFRYWLIHRTLWWALGCLKMGAIWRDGVDRNLERAVIGRRTVECELDLLMLLEEDVDIGPDDRIFLPERERRPGRGEPDAGEILTAIGEWIATDIKEGAKGRDKFMAAVAINALSIVRRELDGPVEYHDAVLCDDILAGRVTLDQPGLLKKLRHILLVKAANDTPKYAGLAAAREKWC